MKPLSNPADRCCGDGTSHTMARLEILTTGATVGKMDGSEVGIYQGQNRIQRIARAEKVLQY